MVEHSGSVVGVAWDQAIIFKRMRVLTNELSYSLNESMALTVTGRDIMRLPSSVSRVFFLYFLRFEEVDLILTGMEPTF